MDRPLTLVNHLNELRKRVIISLGALGIAVIGSFPFSSFLLEVLKLPARGLIEKLVFFSPQDAFLIYMRIAVSSGVIIAMPVILHQFWLFASPAMEEKLSRRAAVFIFFCFFFFVLGCLFAYFILLSPALRFLLSFAKDELEPVISAQKYISFVISLILGCGLVFQMPVLSLALTKLRLLNAGFLRQKYKYAIIAILIAAAAITPTTDAFNMLFLAGPMLLLYEVSIWVSFLARRKA